MPENSDWYVQDRLRVNAPLKAVSFFHQDTRALKRLTPPPVFVQIKRVEPLAEGSQSEFVLWFGPLPIHWLAVHSQADPLSGFTDTQARGPMKRWVHRHQWQAVDDRTTVMEERIEFEHHPGMRGLLTRLLFNRPMLRLMLLYRKWVIQHSVKE